MSIALLITISAAILPAQAVDGSGIEVTLSEPLDRSWEPQWVSIPVELPEGQVNWPDPDEPIEERSDRYLVVNERYADGSIKGATCWARTGLERDEVKRLRFTQADLGKRWPFEQSMDELETMIFGSGTIRIRIPQINQRFFDEPKPCSEVPAPIGDVYAIDRVPHDTYGEVLSQSRLVTGGLEGLGKVLKITMADPKVLTYENPFTVKHEVTYEFEDRSTYTVRTRLIAEEPVVLIEEDFTGQRRGALRFRVTDAWQPTHGQGRGRLHPPGGDRLSKGYELDFSRDWTGRLQPFYAWWSDYGLWWACYERGGDYLAVLPLSPPKWTRPAPNTIFVRTGPRRRIEIECPLNNGTRRWAFVVAPSNEALQTRKGGANLPMMMAIRHGQNPLDKVKDLTLRWDGMESIGHPRIVCAPGDVPDIREKVRTTEEFRRVLDNHPDEPNDPAGLYLATGDKRHLRPAIDDLKSTLRGWVEDALSGSHYSEAFCAIGWTRPLRDYALIYDIVASSDELTGREKDYCQRAWAFLNYCLYDENRWPKANQGFHRGNINFNSDDYTARACVTCLLEGHPLQRRWMDYVEREMAAEFEASVFPGGTWIEAPNYQGYTMHYLMIAMRAMQLNGYRDFSTDPRFKAAMDYFFRIQTPYDVRAGIHMLPTVGDTTSYFHSQSLQNTFSWAATLFRDTDPDFAGRMMYAWRRAGSIVFAAHSMGPGKGWTHPLMFTDPRIEAKAPDEPLRSEPLPGYGAIFRNNYGTRDESYFLFKMGEAGQHYDADEGSFHWYAFGMPLSLDFGSMYSPSIEQPWLHSTTWLAKDGVRFRKWRRGEVTAFCSLPVLDFCSGRMHVVDIDPVSLVPGGDRPQGVHRMVDHGGFVDWRRDALFVRDGDYVVLRDTLDNGKAGFTTGWSVQALADDVDLSEHGAHFIGQYGVDLDVLIAAPGDAELETTTWGHPGKAQYAWAMEKPMPAMGETQIALHASAPMDQDYLAALVPTRAGAEKPSITSPTPDTVRIGRAGGRQLIIMKAESGVTESDGVTFDGRVGVVRSGGGLVHLHIIEGTSIRTPAVTLTCEGPISMTLAGGGFEGRCLGQARTCSIRPPTPPRGEFVLTIDGRQAPLRIREGTLVFDLPAGGHRFGIHEAPRE